MAGRVRAVATHSLHVLTLVLAFAVCLVASVLLNLNLPATRRFACKLTTFLLSDLFEGKLVLEKVDHIGLDGVRGARVRISDDSGAQVIYADGLDASAAVPAMIRSILVGPGDMNVDITRVEIKSADVSLDFVNGDIRIARAFVLRPKPPSPSTSPSRGVHVIIREIVVQHAWAHGTVPSVPPIDADADHVFAELEVGSRGLPTDDAHVSVGRAHIHSRNAPYRADVDGDAHVSVSVPLTTDPVALGAGFHGKIAGIPAKAHATIDGDKLDAWVDVPHVEGATVQAIVPGAPLADVAAAHAEAHGTLEHLDANAHAEVGPGTIDAKATVALANGLRVDGSFVASHVDARSFSKTAPATDASASGKTTVVVENGKVDGSYSVDVARGTVQNVPTPAAHVEGKYSLASVTAIANVDEAGAPTFVHAKLDVPKKAVSFDTRTRCASLRAVPQLQGKVQGDAEVSTHGTVSLEKQTIDAAFEVTGKDIAAQGVTVRHVEASGTVAGPLTSPTIDAAAHGRDVRQGNMRVELLSAAAKVDVGPSVTVRDADVDVSTRENHIKVHADRVRTAGGVKVEGVTVDGLGAVVGVDAEQKNGLLALSVHSQNADLGKIGRVVGVDSLSGRVSINADVRLTHTSANGKVEIDARRATIGPLDRVTAHVDATLLGRGVMGNVHVESPSLGRIDVNTSTIHLNGSPLTPKAWEEATGGAQIDGEIALEKVQPYLPPGTVTQLSGLLIIEGEIERDDPHVAPSVEIDADTKSLDVARAPEWHLQGVDVGVVAKLDGKGHAELDTKAHDAKGDIVAVNGTAELPLAELVTLHAPKEALLRAPATIDVEIPERKIKDFPRALGITQVQGKVQASVKAHGTYYDPKLEGSVKVTNLRTPDLPLALATTDAVTLDYDGSVASVTATVDAKKKTVLQADAQAKVLWSDVLRYGPTADLPWTASAHTVLTGMPLQTLQPLADRGIKGNVSGEASIVDLHDNGHASVQLSFDSLKVGKAKYANAYVRASVATDGAANALVRIDQTDGYLTAKMTGGATWGKNLVPAVDGSKNVVASLDAKNVSAGVAQPFLDEYLNQLDGRVDAQARASIPPSGTPEVSGNIALRQGIVQSPIIGEEFHDVSAKVSLAPNGSDTLATASEITAYGTTGKIMAKATARLHGVHFAGANLVAVVGKDEPVQLTAEGEDYGEGYGNVNVAIAVPRPQETTVKVDIPSFHVRVPEVSTRALQDLTPAENIRVGVRSASGAFLPVSLGAKPEEVAPSNSRLDLDIVMGKDVDVRVGDTVRVQLQGGPHLTSTDTTVVTGQIVLRGGTLDVQGKQFEIQDGGTITFNGGQPGNPDVSVSAFWDAPDGTRVIADFNGPLKTGKVSLRSEPAKSQNDILALILFGSADEAGGANQSESSGLQAATTAGGFATQGLNKAIGDLTGIDATVRVDTSEQNNPKPEVQVQITRSIALELETVIGAIPFGDNPDRNYATVDWRFLPRWSLATTFGDQGTSILDVLWQYRY